MLDKPLFDPQPALVGSGITLVLLGLLLAAISRHFSLPSRFDEILQVLAGFLFVFGLAGIVRGLGFRSPFQP